MVGRPQAKLGLGLALVLGVILALVMVAGPPGGLAQPEGRDGEAGRGAAESGHGAEAVDVEPVGPARAASPGSPGRSPGQVAQPNVFFNPALFYQGLAASLAADAQGTVQTPAWGSAQTPAQTPAWGSAQPVQAPVQASALGGLAGGLVPHHDLAAELLSGFFRRLEEEPPEVILLVGPNHEGLGQPVSTGMRGWQTDFGLVEADLATVTALVEAGLAVVDDQVLTHEHSMGVLMPYIKYHAPEARVVPLILHREITLAQLRRLASELAGHLGDGRILVASVDFSHYLTRVEAEAKDEETMQAIEAGDLAALMQMGPDHLDSPGSLAVLTLAMEAIGAQGPVVTGHTNSGVILRDDLIETTSYFTLVFPRP